jgi:hypothetical protein
MHVKIEGSNKRIAHDSRVAEQEYTRLYGKSPVMVFPALVEESMKSYRCLLLLSSYLCFVSVAFGVNRPEIRAPYITGSIVIDGNSGEWNVIKLQNKGICFFKGDGKTGTSTDLGTTVCKQITNANDCTVNLWLAHDATYLYVLAEVYDDSYEPFDASNLNNMAYLEDTLHLYIDSTNTKRANIPNPPISNQAGYEQFGISTDGNIWGENTDFTTGLAKQPASKGAQPDGTYWRTACRVAYVGDGYLYVFEQSITLAGRAGRNMAAMLPGNSYGFDAEFCDADYGVQLEGFIWWSSNGSTDAWNYENLWGTMTLEPVPESVTLRDFAMLSAHWLGSCSGPDWCGWADLNQSGIVDWSDLLILTSHWLGDNP